MTEVVKECIVSVELLEEEVMLVLRAYVEDKYGALFVATDGKFYTKYVRDKEHSWKKKFITRGVRFKRRDTHI